VYHQILAYPLLGIAQGLPEGTKGEGIELAELAQGPFCVQGTHALGGFTFYLDVENLAAIVAAGDPNVVGDAVLIGGVGRVSFG
jgi:hypothetical protein